MESLFNEFITANRDALHLGVATLLGMLVGLQRGWQARDRDPGERIAGIRTYALTGLFGGITALLAEEITPWLLPASLLALTVLNLLAYRVKAPLSGDYSITGAIGLMLTFTFGVMAVSLDVTLAAAAAVVTTLLLDHKTEIHGLLGKLQAHELDAALKLLVISVVMLPLLPNKGFGPGGVLNPYQIWWLVVMIASISFVGYFAIRVGGTGKGILFTSLFAGLSSSTALTLHFARQARDTEALSPQLAAGILIACGTMFPRVLVYCAVINPTLLPTLVQPVLAMALLLYVPAGLIWYRNRATLTVGQPSLNRNPLDLQPALLFGLLLTLVLLVGHWLKEWLGDAGIFALSAVSGIADVDAITLSLTRMSQSSITTETAVIGIVLASSVNNTVKSGMAGVIGPKALGTRVAVPMGLSLVAGLAVAGFHAALS
ncbi:MgtC/SapB family protein [Salicola sp. Rm-C-2C1-2]|uniref:MgtC/SapB family protein n=1 Tax=Salicola sp. Rm-C-2C1-2 TaxID=3141321 RepID=UPI0032E4930E